MTLLGAQCVLPSGGADPSVLLGRSPARPNVRSDCAPGALWFEWIVTSHTGICRRGCLWLASVCTDHGHLCCARARLGLRISDRQSAASCRLRDALRCSVCPKRSGGISLGRRSQRTPPLEYANAAHRAGLNGPGGDSSGTVAETDSTGNLCPISRRLRHQTNLRYGSRLCPAVDVFGSCARHHLDNRFAVPDGSKSDRGLTERFGREKRVTLTNAFPS